MTEQTELEQLRRFAARIMEAWPDGDVDGGDLQQVATECGMLEAVTMSAPCGEECSCREYLGPDAFEYDVTCYRSTDLLKKAREQK